MALKTLGKIVLVVVLILIGILILVGIGSRVTGSGGVASDEELISLCQEWKNAPNGCKSEVYGTIGDGRLAQMCEERYAKTEDGAPLTCQKICRNYCILIIPSE